MIGGYEKKEVTREEHKEKLERRIRAASTEKEREEEGEEEREEGELAAAGRVRRRTF